MSLAPRPTDGCLPGAELARFVDGEFTGSEQKSLRAHLASCARCRAELGALEALVADLGRDPIFENSASGDGAAAGQGADLVAAVLRRAAVPPRRHAPTRMAGLAMVTAAAAAAAGILGAVAVERHRPGQPSRADDHFQVRGAPESPDRWIAIRPYRVDGEGTSPLPTEGGALSADDGLLIAYDNGGPSPFRYLMVYAVDERGRVYWDYPATSDTRAVGIAIEPGVGHELRDEVRWSLSRGRLRLHGLFSREPISVGEVERALRHARGRLPLPDTGQHEIALDVVAEAGEKADGDRHGEARSDVNDSSAGRAR